MMSYIMSRETIFVCDLSKNFVAHCDVLHDEQGNHVRVLPL